LVLLLWLSTEAGESSEGAYTESWNIWRDYGKQEQKKKKKMMMMTMTIQKAAERRNDEPELPDTPALLSAYYLATRI